MVVNDQIKNIISCIFPIKEECMISSGALIKLNQQLDLFFPLKHLSYVFEFRTKDNDEQVDLAMAISQKEDFVFFINYYNEKSPEITQLLKQFLLLINSNTNCKSLWLETDLDDREYVQTPSIFVSLKPNNKSYKEIEKYSKILNFNRKEDLNNKLLHQCLDALKYGQYVEHLGVMHSREAAQTTRLYIRGLTFSTIHDFLEKSNWPGDKGQVISLIKEFETQAEYISIAIEFNDQILPTLGIEFHFNTNQQAYLSFLNKLQVNEHCSSFRSKLIEEIISPEKLKYEKCSYKRSLGHFKLKIDGKGLVESKVYVQLTPNFLSLFGF